MYNHTPLHIRQLRLSLSMILITVAMLVCSCSTSIKHVYQAPESKAATVSEANSYQDKLQIPFDDKGLDINVNMTFDETENILTLSLTGTRQLMVFRDEVQYKRVFRKAFLGKRKLDLKRMPYPVLIRPNTKITLSKQVWKDFNKKRRNHIFNNWMTNVSPELSTISPNVRADESTEATLIVDSIVQRFRVDPKATKASFTLRNILVADPDGKSLPVVELKRNSSAKLNYQIVCDKDLNLTYNINIKRDPCFGMDSLIDATNIRINQVMKAYANLREASPVGIVKSEEEQGIFNQHRQYLLSQYQFITDTTSCFTLQAAYSKYNEYVDSIAKAPCKVVKAMVSDDNGNGGILNMGVRASTILDAAHRLDNTVSQILVTRDVMQQHDLIVSGRNTISTITRAVSEGGLHDDEQRKAYNIFLKAKSYFNATISGE